MQQLSHLHFNKKNWVEISNKRLADFTNFISSNDFLRNDKIRLIETFLVIWKCIIIMEDNLFFQLTQILKY